jgi:2-oxoglutarate dehydrogenase E1 component
MERSKQVSNDKMLLKVDTAYTKEGLTQVANAVCNCQKIKVKNPKADQRQKNNVFETDNRLGYGRAPCLWIYLQEGYNVRISRRRAWNFSHRHAVVK